MASLVVIFLEILEGMEVVSPLMESSIRLIVVSGLMGFLIADAARTSLPNVATLAIVGLAGFIVAFFVLQLVRQIPHFDAWPIMGKSAPWRHMLEKIVIAGWTCCAFFLLYVLLRQVEGFHEELAERQRVQEKVNAKLEATIQELRETEQQVVQQERLAALGQLASGIAHDLNNALSPVMVYSNLLLLEQDEVDDEEAVKMIADGTAHAAQIVSQLQHLYHPSAGPTPYHDLVDVSDLVRLAVRLTKPRWSDEATKNGILINVETVLSPQCIVQGDATELQQMITNLILNAADSMLEDGRIEIRTQTDGQAVVLDVTDTGPGMTHEQRGRCFEPFYTSKPNGSGLGLSVCKGIATRHSGEIQVLESGSCGTVMRVDLPLAQARDEGKKQPAANSLIARRLLYIDDDDSVRQSVAQLLRKGGFLVDTAGNGEDGLNQLGREPYELLLTDLGMQGTTGWDVVQSAKETHPDLTVGVLSGWSRAEVNQRFAADDHLPDFIVEKPISLERLKEMLSLQPHKQEQESELVSGSS